jgi:GNAT superfamily N-acetyltransferase
MAQRGVLHVRPATLDDADAIGEAHAEAWRVGYATLFRADVLGPLVDERRRWWRPTLASGLLPGTLLVGEVDARVVAFVHYGVAGDGRAATREIFGFYSHPSAWGSGIAGALMDEAVHDLRRGDADAVCLWTHSGASRARRFYEKTGFVLSGATGSEVFGTSEPATLVEYVRPLRRAATHA